MANDLVLDTAIRDWVLVPLSVVMVLIGVLRHFVSKLMRTTPNPDLKSVREGQVVLRAKTLRAAANYIPAKSFRQRRTYFNNEENGLLHVPKGQGQNMQAQMFSDPNMAMDMMKKNLSMIIPQTLTFAWVNFFFSGFVAAKIPFPLTQRFRGMLQNGIDLSAADVSYVSSRSWYFLNLFGLRGLFSLILGEENATDDTTRLMAMQMGAFGADPAKILGAEKDGLDLLQHDWVLSKIEQKAEEVLRRKLEAGTPYTPKTRSFTAEEVAKHNSAHDCWIIVKNKVYDVTPYVEEHPGGYAILNNAGGDSTLGFYGMQHASRVHEMVDEFYIGELSS